MTPRKRSTPLVDQTGPRGPLVDHGRGDRLPAGPEPETTSATTQSVRAYHALRHSIISGALAPGERLNIARLTEKLGVSLGAAREALSMLASESLASFEPQKGYAVSRVSRSDLVDITQARVELEQLCLASAMEAGNIAWEGEVLASAHRMARLEEELPHYLNDERWMKAHAHFHATLVSGCTNAWLLRLRGMVFEHSERYRRLAVPLAAAHRDLRAEHQAMVDAILRHDKERARQLIADHVWETARALLAAPLLSDA